MEACRLLTALAGISGLIRKAQSRQGVLPGTVPCVLLCKTAGRRIYWQGTGRYNGSAHLISGAYLPYLLKPFWNSFTQSCRLVTSRRSDLINRIDTGASCNGSDGWSAGCSDSALKVSPAMVSFLYSLLFEFSPNSSRR